ncbi:cell division protein ZipA [Neptunomonas qingdaonensis]|uniref:Cell division protein ZipA n=1 Tax=Neptunomonas qingdaonensis TaxID=1045558 RepID=A0A1I2MY47_9GAMM|nr:cell division protein ZipA [Neptunomonas qingdaonensis]SFF96353.1 cell division protein ZipA [Neptunomonas qingdaonensis]
MDIGLREWLIIGGILVIGLIIFDGWRRMKGQRNTLKIDIDRSLSDDVESAPSADAHNPELPNGGARTQSRTQTSYNSQPFESHAADVAGTGARIDPGFEHLNDYLETGTSGQAHVGKTNDARPNAGSSSLGATAGKATYNTEHAVTQQEELDPLFDDIPEILSPVRRAVVDEEAVKKSDQASELFDLEQPITVLMRQASEKHDEESVSAAQEEMFFYPEKSATGEAEASDTDAYSTPDYSNKSGDQSVTDDRYSNESDMRAVHAEAEDVREAFIAEEKIDSEDKVPAAADVKVFEAPEDERQATQDDTAASSAHHFKSEGNAAHLPEQDSLFENDTSFDKDPAFDKDNLEHARSDRKAREHAPEPEEVLVITVVGKQHQLDGQTLLQVVLACGMRFGDMSLFHRFEEGIDKGAVQFSMANAVNPGTFDLEHMDEMTTPGVSFFMSMSEPADVKNAFECMLATAETVSKHLGGDLLDENRSVMRPQTKAHYRERIREYEMHNRHRRK